MICPYCESLIRKMPDSGTCPNCGAPLGAYRSSYRAEGQAALSFPEPPVGIYKDVAGYLEVSKDSVTFYRNQWPLAAKTRRTIPLREIFAVSFEQGASFRSGFLCVRQWQDRHLPLAASGAEAVLDETSVYFRQSKNAEFHRVYVFLQQCAEIVKQAHLDLCDGEAGSLLGKYTGYYGYMELGADAVTICKKLPLSLPSERVIPYAEIAEVAFREAKGQHDGGLSIRGRNNGKILTTALSDALIDDTSIDFSERSNDKMRRVYDFLMGHVKNNFREWSEA